MRATKKLLSSVTKLAASPARSVRLKTSQALRKKVGANTAATPHAPKRTEANPRTALAVLAGSLTLGYGAGIALEHFHSFEELERSYLFWKTAIPVYAQYNFRPIVNTSLKKTIRRKNEDDEDSGMVREDDLSTLKSKGRALATLFSPEMEMAQQRRIYDAIIEANHRTNK